MSARAARPPAGAFLWLGLGLGLAACATAAPTLAPARPADMVATPGYQLGHRLGCIDGESLVGRPSFVTADTDRLATDPAYAAGWTDGQLECYEAFLRHPRSWNSSER